MDYKMGCPIKATEKRASTSNERYRYMVCARVCVCVRVCMSSELICSASVNIVTLTMWVIPTENS